MKELSNEELLQYAAELEEINNSGLAEETMGDNAWSMAQLKPREISPALKRDVDDLRKRNAEKLKQYNAEKKIRKKEIVSEALNSTFIDLNSTLTVEHKKLLISLLTSEYTAKMEKQINYINKNIERGLRSLMPKDILNSWNKHPDLMIPSPGFTYHASKEYAGTDANGNALEFKVTLNLPMYFHPNCEETYKKYFESRVPVIDKAVELFNKYKTQRNKQEVKYANTLTKINTFIKLLEHNAIWYEKLIIELKKQKENEEGDSNS